ncbi:hypothetical protein MEX01_51670 [Methylorubrum extorquens]|uniref:hypothetical protein n=1 Tax=Methylorubrum extorquens TaxID=408 RepID=UPI00116CEFB2|nr:hypothetical protein [Methylorubrum extorquens]GEL44576.1 hypothetical protein MEX01_51670 [Methylorubrum extorquens]
MRNPLKLTTFRRRADAPTLKERAATLKATAARVLRRRAIPGPVAAQAPATGPDPKLIAMVEEWEAIGRASNDHSIPDSPEFDALLERHTELQRAICLFPSRSVLDMQAKVPVFRDEAHHAIGSLEDGKEPGFSMPGAAWLGIFRDIEHLAGTPAADAATAVAARHELDSIFAAISASRAAQAAMERWAVKTNAAPKRTKPDFAEEDRLNAAQYEAHDEVIATVPTTAAGRLALLEYLRWQMRLHGMTNGEPPEASSPFWRDAYKALRAALAADMQEPEQADSPAERNLSKEAFDYAYGLDLSSVSFKNLLRLYEVFHASNEFLSPVEGEPMFDTGAARPCSDPTAGGEIIAAEINRMGCLRDAMADELRRRKPRTERERNGRLEVLVVHEIRCEMKIRDKDLLAEINAAWGA